MNAWHAVGVGFVMALATGCGSSGSPPPSASLLGTYTAVAEGPYVRMTFFDSQHYMLEKSNCSTACEQSGTYAVNAAGTILALRDEATGQIIELPFSALQTAPSPATLLSARIRVLDNLTNPTGSLTGSGGSLTGGSSGSLTSGSGQGLSSGSQPLVSDGGALSFGDAGSLTGGGAPMPGFNAGMQPFAGDDAGAGDAGITPPPSSADAAQAFVPDGGALVPTSDQ